MTDQVLTIYDPRIDNRVFVLASGKSWHSLGTDIVVFETENYAKLTDGLWLCKLLTVLSQHAGIPQFLLGIDPAPKNQFPEWFQNLKIEQGHLSCRVDCNSIKRLAAYYDEKADYGIWTFHGIGPNPHALSGSRLPEVLLASAQVSFYLEIDLDGLAIGFVRSPLAPDAAIAALREL